MLFEVSFSTLKFLAERDPILAVVYDTTNTLSPSEVVLHKSWDGIADTVATTASRPGSEFAIGIVYTSNDTEASKKAHELASKFLDTHATVFVGSNCDASDEKVVNWIDTPELDSIVDQTGSSNETGDILIDTRRRDELNNFGQVRNAKNIPVEEICDALALHEGAFERKYGFPLPGKSTTVVTYCRTNRRAHFCTLLLKDLGFTNVKTYKEGVVGWAKTHKAEVAGARGYDAYELHEPVPQAHAN
ncbi:hypothetical protein SARC_00669 [Sphaeroforma arctica JP610]|uniref:Rhodanese domain-containing protein n=1 Tax=Sphaeroforma arctica JP610 TaxID=667725 RepID=A0A0L0GEA7_9EUKA|nr:hypothetical protein SARC_00669 [Sphaeroforma arctica JP610]KNC87234.1 hypothetical protein SARC_00669 [Sphaeroforma arctica JP610]|eukprot:XP_014161136.1 hypothetical protein SARC_00669 [Sphaeroforma arctica JP610]